MLPNTSLFRIFSDPTPSSASVVVAVALIVHLPRANRKIWFQLTFSSLHDLRGAKKVAPPPPPPPPIKIDSRSRNGLK